MFSIMHCTSLSHSLIFILVKHYGVTLKKVLKQLRVKSSVQSAVGVASVVSTDAECPKSVTYEVS